LRVDRISELFSMAEILNTQPRLKGPRLAILTNAGGPGVLATDALIAGAGDYIEAQERVDAAYKDPCGWDRKAIVNVARAGKFSSDRTIKEYASQIWHVQPCAVVPQPIARPGLD